MPDKVERGGHIVADDSMNEAREILRLIDAGDEEALNVYLAKLWQRKRRAAAREVLSSDGPMPLEPAV